MVLTALLVLLAGCVKQPGAVRSPEPSNVAVAALLTSVDDGGTVAVSEAAMARLSAVIEARNLRPQPSGSDALVETPTAPLRLELLAEQSGDASLLVLVEASARFFSQMNGQYRWTVDVRATLVPRDKPAAALTDSYEVPVFLQFSHEGETEALQSALPMIERRLGRLLDQQLRGQQASGG